MFSIIIDIKSDTVRTTRQHHKVALKLRGLIITIISNKTFHGKVQKKKYN